MVDSLNVDVSKLNELTNDTAPLFNSEGKVAFFLGGQINCSTTIHNRSDILRALSLSDDPIDENIEFSSSASISQNEAAKKRGFFRSLRMRTSSSRGDDREAGMEAELMQKIEKVDFKQQMKMFYTAYSKVWVISYLMATPVVQRSC